MVSLDRVVDVLDTVPEVIIGDDFVSFGVWGN